MTTKNVTSDTDGVTTRDRASRRRFMLKSASLVAVAGVASTAGRSALAADCDRGGPGGAKPEHGGNGSDSDTGASADPTGCGRNYEEKPKISQRGADTLPGDARKVSVAKLVG